MKTAIAHTMTRELVETYKHLLLSDKEKTAKAKAILAELVKREQVNLLD
jgi:uncharacterized protein YqgQ